MQKRCILKMDYLINVRWVHIDNSINEYNEMPQLHSKHLISVTKLIIISICAYHNYITNNIHIVIDFNLFFKFRLTSDDNL